MKLKVFMLIALFGSLLAAAESPLSEVEVFVARETVRAGTSLPVAVKITLADGWHTYAEEPGDSGMPPSIKISGLSVRLEVERWEFPPHQTFVDHGITTYGYEDEVIVFGAVAIPPETLEGEINMEFSIKWAICKDVCMFFSEKKMMTVTVGTDGSEETEQWRDLRNRE